MTTDQLCPSDCPAGTSSKSGVYTGKCVRVSPEGAAKIERRCEVQSWCPILDVRHQTQSLQVDPALKMEGVDRIGIEMTVNARFPKFEQSTQFNVSSSIKQILHASHYEDWSKTPTIKPGENDDEEMLYKKLIKEGAVILFQFKYDCDIDRVHSEKCVPEVNVVRVRSDGLGESEKVMTTKKSGDNIGYGFTTIDYFTKENVVVLPTSKGGKDRSRRIRQLKGLRFIFDVTGRARRFNGAVALSTIVSSFGFAALAFIVVNSGRILCEEPRAVPTREERERQKREIKEMRRKKLEREDSL